MISPARDTADRERKRLQLDGLAALMRLHRRRQRLLDRERGEKARHLEGAADAAADDLAPVEAGDVLARQQDAAGIGRKAAGDQVEQGRLAGAVGADDGAEASRRRTRARRRAWRRRRRTTWQSPSSFSMARCPASRACHACFLPPPSAASRAAGPPPDAGFRGARRSHRAGPLRRPSTRTRITMPSTSSVVAGPGDGDSRSAGAGSRCRRAGPGTPRSRRAGS